MRHRFEFANGYAASVIPDGDGYEVAVMWGNRLCYTTPVTDNVMRITFAADVLTVLAEIESLPRRLEAK